MVSVPIFTTLGMTPSTASTVASRRASASTAPNAGKVTAPMNIISTAARPREPGHDFQTFITVRVETTNRVRVRSISSAVGTTAVLVALCALDFADPSVEKQRQGVRHFV